MNRVCVRRRQASSKGYAAVAGLLLADERVDRNVMNEMGDTALHNAARHGHGDVVRMLLADELTRPNLLNAAGYSPLLEAR